MIWQASRPTARALRRIRFGLLALVALFLAHDAVFLAQYGIGEAFAAAMRRSGHDGYWPAYMLLVAVAGAALVAITALRLGRLRLRRAALGAPRRDATVVLWQRVRAPGAPSYRGSASPTRWARRGSPGAASLDRSIRRP